MKTPFRVAFPGCCFLLLVLLLPAPSAAQPPPCCTIAQNRGQEAFNKQDYDTAISHWTNGKECPDASKCPNLDVLIQKARAEKKRDDDKAADAAYVNTKAINTKAAYQAFIRNYPNSRHVADARSRKEALDWLDAQNKNTRAAYEAFIKNYPNSRHIAGARSRIEAFDRQVAPVQKLEADMVRITGAAFIMGCKSGRDTDCNDSEKPAHEVRLRDFYIGRYEVTQAQWRAVMGIDPPLLYNKGCDQCPVERVSWDDIQTFLKKLNILTGKRYRLPTEAEWEYAARGGNLSKGYLYSGSNTMGEVAWYDANAKLGNTNGAQKTTRPVGTKKPNELGLYDMSGNVWEWCEDDWHDNYNGAPADGSAWVGSSRVSIRVARAGGWDDTTGACRAANRFGGAPEGRYQNVGFRLAL